MNGYPRLSYCSCGNVTVDKQPCSCSTTKETESK